MLRVRGTASQGSAELIVEFDPKSDPRVDLQSVDQALAQARAAVPAASKLTAVIVKPSSEGDTAFLELTVSCSTN